MKFMGVSFCRRCWHPAICLLFLGLGSIAGAKEAGRPSEGETVVIKVRALYKSGMSHYNLGEFAPALADFKEAYRLSSEPVFLFNLGQCYRQLKDPESAAQFYRTYLRSAPDAQNRKDVKELIAEAERTLAAKEKQGTPAPMTTEPPHLDATPPQKEATPAALATPTLTAPKVEKPRSWLWPVVGTAIGLVVVGGAVGLGVGLSHDSSAPMTTYGTVGGLP